VSTVCAEPAVARWTAEQLYAIERREGELLLDAGAGSGKTSVLVERFARAVLEDGVEVGAILAITFTEKAAAELRERIRARLRALGALDAARATEGAFISTIHGFCARVLRANALSAGIDPGFAVLDEPKAQRLADGAFDEALEQLARDEAAAVDLIAAYTHGGLRGATVGLYAELRSRGETAPRLPALGQGPDLAASREQLLAAAALAARELGALAEPSAKVRQALERLERLPLVVRSDAPWPGEVARLCLPGGNGAALSTSVCAAYTEALDRFKVACEFVRVAVDHRLLARLLELFGAAYARRKRAASAVDFADLELLTRDLLNGEAALRERYRARFTHVMVDELQDTNGVQFELIGQVAGENVFMVGDAQQSIYGFRHADVELFEQLGAQLEARGARARLATNFRSRPEILEVIGQVFAPFGFASLVAGREPDAGAGEAGGHAGEADGRAGEADGHAGEALVELLIADKGADWAAEGITAPWRVAEARALARRVGELIDTGAPPRDFVVLTRATTDLRAYERALEEQGIPTYVIGGRGYWGHPQVLDMVGYLRALANPRDEEALYTLLSSPMVGLSVDALVILAAAGRVAGRDPWWVIREPPDGALEELSEENVARIHGFAGWFADERAAMARLSVEELIDRALARTGYDLAVLAMPGGRRRLANIRKLMRLAREQEALAGRDLRVFLELVRGREAGWAGFGDARESEAPVEGEALDAVRLMTIHRSKGLEFPIVCLADLGRQPWNRTPTVRLGRDGRFGIRLAEPGTGKREPALDYETLGAEQQEVEEREERRLFYVAMTRAKEHLIVSGAAKLESWDKERSPMGWIGPALIEAGLEPAYVLEQGASETDRGTVAGDEASPEEPPRAAPRPLPAARPAPGVSHLSYSSLGEYARCGYRFYMERVLRVPGASEGGAVGAGVASGGGAGVASAGGEAAAGGIGAAERGIIVHALLEKLDFRRPVAPPPGTVIERSEWPLSFQEAEGITELISAFAASELCARLGRASDVRREQRFSFLLADEMMITGALDVLARERDEVMLVVDYKSDRLEGREPSGIVASEYRVQRLIYALAALRAGAQAVEVVHVFLEAPGEPVIAHYTREEQVMLEQQLAALADGVLQREFKVTDVPHRAVCSGCPAEGGLCSWPVELTRRERPDQLF
jgi:ATP-dependent helicase/nuclease subunit A